ncbi:MAG: PilZ domain-containing protein [Lachnospiraceae bacterium]|nr:PilZ domain-containing protein [Lachnospiraceae bacterium]
MHISEIPENSRITVIASINREYIEFDTHVIGKKGEYVLIELIKNDEGKAIGFTSDKITLDVSYVIEEEKPPYIWRNVKIANVKKGNHAYQILAQSVDGKRENRRGAYRLYLGVDAILDVPGHVKSTRVVLKDISSTGFAFVYNEELPNGAICRIHTSIDSTKMALTGGIVRQQVLDNGRIIYGCHMDKFSKELEKFIAQKQREIINSKFK